VTRQALGDWQTPVALAEAVLARVARMGGPAPAVVLEPTCGEGAFLVAAARRFEGARLAGYELNERHAAIARARLPGPRAEVTVADFFHVDWERALSALAEPILVTGNPPWVTSATLGSLGARNLPEKSNLKGLSGLDALTGKSNFDVSEWMILRLLAALQGRRATLAMLCKTAVARRVIELAAAKRWDVRPGGLWGIDARRHFRAAVDAVLFVCETGAPARSGEGWPCHASLDAPDRLSTMAVVDGALIADAESVARTAHLAGRSKPTWRSGLKHDCARVMELAVEGRGFRNGLEERVDIEAELVFPLMKSSDVAHGVTHRARAVIDPQRTLGEDTASLERRAPRAWRYLAAHRDLLSARKSSIYRGQPDFAIFGIGPYSFSPWKVAISGLYKRCAFTLIGPEGDRPVMLDDTCYFLPFEREADAREAWSALQSPLARDFLAGRIFWDAKRPINKAILQQLDLEALLSPSRGGPERGRARC